VKKTRKFLLTSVKEAAKGSDMYFREKQFGDNLYILFNQPPKDLFSIIGSKSGCPDLGWMKFQPGDIQASVEETPAEKPKTEPAPVKITSWAESVDQEHEQNDRAKTVVARFRTKLLEISQINSKPIDDREIIRCGGQKGLEFWEGVSKSSKKGAGAHVRDGTVLENVDKLMTYFRDLGWAEDESALEDFAICRLAVMNCRVLSNGMLKRV